MGELVKGVVIPRETDLDALGLAGLKNYKTNGCKKQKVIEKGNKKQRFVERRGKIRFYCRGEAGWGEPLVRLGGRSCGASTAKKLQGRGGI